MNIPNLKGILKKISFKKRGEFRAIGEKADHDWRYILIIFFCITFGAIGAGLYVFILISKGEIFTVEAPVMTDQKTINQKELDSTIRFFDERSKRFTELQNNPPTVGDPSL